MRPDGPAPRISCHTGRPSCISGLLLIFPFCNPSDQMSKDVEMAAPTSPGAFPRHPVFRFLAFSLALICTTIFLFSNQFSLRPSSPQLDSAHESNETLLDDVLNSTLGVSG